MKSGDVLRFRIVRNFYVSLDEAPYDCTANVGDMCILIECETKRPIEGRDITCFWLLLATGAVCSIILTNEGFPRAFDSSLGSL